MATTSSNLVAGKIAGKVASQGGNRNNGRIGLKAKVAAGVAILGCAATLAFGGLQAVDRSAPQAQPVAAPINVAQSQTQAGSGYLEFSPGDISSTTIPLSSMVQTQAGIGYQEFSPADVTLPVSNVARTQTEAGAGYLEFQPGEGAIVSTGASHPAAGIGLREYLDGEGPTISLPLSSPGTQPAPEFGPQP